jgi:general secretion pathway protein K
MSRKRPPSRNHGFVLIVVICVVMAMTGLVLAFNRKARAAVQTADGLRRSAQALCCARAGLAAATAVIRSQASSGSGSASGVSPDVNMVFDLGDGSCHMELSDEQGKLNLNRIIDPNGHIDRTRVDQLLRLIDLTSREDGGEPIGYGMVPALIDWIDRDEQVTSLDFIQRQNTGAESDYYQGLERPYRCANRPLETPEELMLIARVTAQTYQRLAPYVTVYGDGLINVNVAPKRVIESLCEQMDSALAQVIVDRRQVRPFRSLEELRRVPAMTEPIYQRIRRLATVQPTGGYYRLQATGEVDGARRTVCAVLKNNPGEGMVDVINYREERSKR